MTNAQRINEDEANRMKLKDKVALITGATSGIGEATARTFAEEGAHLVLTGRNEKRGQKILKEVQDIGADAFFIAGDITDPEFAQQLVDNTVERFGRLDVLFNNAGIFDAGTAEEISIDRFKSIMEINVFSVFYLSRVAIPVMRKQGGGVIVNNASDWGLVGGTKAVSYCTSKGAVVQMTRSMALDHAREGVRINAVCPGDTATPMLDIRANMLNTSSKNLEAVYSEALPIGRMAKAEEIAKVVLFLACEDSSFVVGASLPVDGGNTCQ